MTRDTSLSPENTIITFDLHGVLLHFDILHLIKLFFTRKETLILMRHGWKPSVLYDVIRLRLENVVAEKYFVQLTTLYPQFSPCFDFFADVANSQKPEPATIALAQELKDRGYPLHLLSNIGERCLDALDDSYTPVIELFDVLKVATAAENYVGKPNLGMYRSYQEEHNPEGKTVVFIDDKMRNIHAAREVGFLAVPYRSADDLREKLDLLGVL